jgi:hypothetical protein
VSDIQAVPPNNDQNSTAFMNRRTFLALPAIAAAGVLTGCSNTFRVTPSATRVTGYRDTLSAFLVTADGNRLVVLGKQCHYVFDLPRSFAVALAVPGQARPTIHVVAFETDRGLTTADYWLQLSRDDAPPGSALRERALASGFVGHGGALEAAGTIVGIAFQPNDVMPSSIPQVLGHPYDVEISERSVVFGQSVLPRSPVRVTTDGAVSLAGAPLTPIAVTAFVVVAKSNRRAP